MCEFKAGTRAACGHQRTNTIVHRCEKALERLGACPYPPLVAVPGDCNDCTPELERARTIDEFIRSLETGYKAPPKVRRRNESNAVRTVPDAQRSQTEGNVKPASP